MSIVVRKWWPLGPDGKPDKRGEPRDAYQIRLRYKHPDGNVTKFRKTADGETKKEAEAEERQLVAALVNGTFRKNAGLSFREVAERFLEAMGEQKELGELRPASLEFYRDRLERILIPKLGSNPASSITDDTVQALKKSLKGTSRGMLNTILRTLKRTLLWGVEKGLVDRAPKIAIKSKAQSVKEEIRYLTKEELRIYLGAAGEWRDFVLFAARTGMRVGELRALRPARLDLKHKRVKVFESLDDEDNLLAPKNGEGRTVPLSAQTVKMLEGRDLKGAYVFPNEDGGYLSRSTISAAFVAISERCGVKASPHDMRHTFATHGISRGIKWPVLKVWGGWSSLAVLERYAKLLPGTDDEMIDRLDE
jgi:integrase